LLVAKKVVFHKRLGRLMSALYAIQTSWTTKDGTGDRNRGYRVATFSWLTFSRMFVLLLSNACAGREKNFFALKSLLNTTSCVFV
ncbi:MAG: hypothetical protein P8X63_11050, partial [Desulfuromonadaceae bacterium]